MTPSEYRSVGVEWLWVTSGLRLGLRDLTRCCPKFTLAASRFPTDCLHTVDSLVYVLTDHRHNICPETGDALSLLKDQWQLVGLLQNWRPDGGDLGQASWKDISISSPARSPGTSIPWAVSKSHPVYHYWEPQLSAEQACWLALVLPTIWLMCSLLICIRYTN